MRSKLKIVAIICFLLFSFSKCVTYNENFPFVAFERTYDLYLTSNADLYLMSGSIIDTTVGTGYKGIIVFRRAADGYPDDFICFDRACTSDRCNYYNKIAIDRFDIFAKCPVCGTQYDLLSYGWPTTSNAEGNKSNPLQQYSTYFSGRHVVVENK